MPSMREFLICLAIAVAVQVACRLADHYLTGR
jgi:hypothetical protein